jgi:hypothetical protein
MKLSRKIQINFKTRTPVSLLDSRVSWFKRLQRRFHGANSKTVSPAEQSEWTRTVIRSVEVTIDTEEFTLYETTNRVRFRADAPVTEMPDDWINDEMEAKSRSLRKQT